QVPRTGPFNTMSAIKNCSFSATLRDRLATCFSAFIWILTVQFIIIIYTFFRCLVNLISLSGNVQCGFSDTFVSGFLRPFPHFFTAPPVSFSGMIAAPSYSFSRPAANATKCHHSRFLLRDFAPMQPLQPASAAPSPGFSRFGLVRFKGMALTRQFFLGGS
ncbi:MAG: hypothetical protein PHH91_12765, partial [Desulfuromonadaceae bacterium]|nr:hypothetical protein [Desulfuromonadaceae bacterium]